jgi:hypothetical protein
MIGEAGGPGRCGGARDRRDDGHAVRRYGRCAQPAGVGRCANGTQAATEPARTAWRRSNVRRGLAGTAAFASSQRNGDEARERHLPDLRQWDSAARVADRRLGLSQPWRLSRRVSPRPGLAPAPGSSLLSDGREWSTDELRRVLAERLQLSDQELREPAGQRVARPLGSTGPRGPWSGSVRPAPSSRPGPSTT